MKKGYGIFGKPYEIMLKNDLHAPASIDHALMRDMVLLEEESLPALYQKPVRRNMEDHELYAFAQQFKAASDRQSIRNVLDYTSSIAMRYDVDFKDMVFGGTEKQILERGTDWCADMARVGAVLLQCLGIPCRILHLVNLNKAYHGHVVGEAYYEGCYGVVDFIYGYQFYNYVSTSAKADVSGRQPATDAQRAPVGDDVATVSPKNTDHSVFFMRNAVSHARISCARGFSYDETPFSACSIMRNPEALNACPDTYRGL